MKGIFSRQSLCRRFDFLETVKVVEVIAEKIAL